MASTSHSPVQPTSDRRPPYCLAPDVLLVPVPDGSARLVDLHGQFFALSEVAAQMLQGTLELGPDEAAERVAQCWGIEHERAQADLNAFVAKLLHQGLLVPAGQIKRRTRLRQKLAAIVVSALVRLTRSLRPTIKGKVSGLLTVAKLSCHWLGWANTVGLWQRLFTRPKQALEGTVAEQTRLTFDDAVRRAVSESAFSHACKERGLAAWAMARRAGLSARLIIGMSLCPVHGHCWATVGDTILGDDEEQCGQYEPMHTYE